MQLTAAGGQSKQLSKTLMNDYNNFMNEDKWNYLPKCGKKNPKPKNHNTKSSGLSSYKWLITHFSPRQQYHTVSKTLTFSLASSDVYSNTQSQILDLGIKKALACSCVRARQNCKVELLQQQREMQAWTAGSRPIFGPTVPMLLNRVGRGTAGPASSRARGSN